MKKIMEAILTVAFVCLSLIFTIICLLTYLGVIPVTVEDTKVVIDPVVLVIFAILGVMWLGLGIYVLYCNFAPRNVLKYVTISTDNQTSTKATTAVLKKLALEEAETIEGLKIKKVVVMSDELQGLNMKIIVNLTTPEVAQTIDQLRVKLLAKYKEVLSLQFTTIDFQIHKVNASVVANTKDTQTPAETTPVDEQTQQEGAKIDFSADGATIATNIGTIEDVEFFSDGDGEEYSMDGEEDYEIFDDVNEDFEEIEENE